MKAFTRTPFLIRLGRALLLGVILVARLSATAATIQTGGLTVTKSGNDLIFSFPTTTATYYGLQTSPDLLQPWTNVQSGIQGDGTVKTVTVSNAISGSQGFFKLSLQPTPTRLLLPQSDAFAILGHSCGGIQEKVSVSGFDPTTGYPVGIVNMSTTCSTGGRGSRPATFTAAAAVTWDFTGNVVSTNTPNVPPGSPTFTATDASGDVIYNVGTAAYLAVPAPAAPTGVSAVQSGDEFQVSWTPNGVNPGAIVSSTLTATPVDSTAPILTTTVAGVATSGVLTSLAPATTYQITVVNTSIGGSGPASSPVSVTTEAASIAPSAPTGVQANWANLDPSGTTDTLVATWQAAVPGNSPVDEYQITIKGSDGGGTFTQTVSGTTLTANFTVDYIPNWSVTVQAHNAVGWGPSSAVVTLGGL